MPVKLLRWDGSAFTPAASDSIAVEEPLEIRVNARPVAVTMRTPGHDRELAAGFLLTEGIVRCTDDILDVLICRDLPAGKEGNVVDVQLAKGVTVDFDRLTRHVYGASSCGLCGKATLDAVLQNFSPVSAGPRISPTLLAALPERLKAAQPGFAASGGLHASAIFTSVGDLVVVREDVGRHNALDKVLGAMLLTGKLPLSNHVLLVSGRVSFELVQKALAAGIRLIAGIGAPSTLAVDCANRGNMSLVGFLRPDRMNVYSGEQRLL